MKKRLIISFLMVFFSLSLFGCANLGGVFNPSNSQNTQTQSGKNTVSVKEDLDNYINSGLSSLLDIEQTALDSYSSVSGDNYTDDATMYKEMKNVAVPKYTEFVQKLQKLKPKTDKVQEIHNLYVTGANYQLEAFKQILTALEKQDSGLVEQANQKLDAGKEKIDEFLTEIAALASANNVDINQLNATSSASVSDVPETGNSDVSVQDDLINYINDELPKAASLEDEAVSTYESVSGDNYTDDNTMYKAIVNTVIPDYEQFLNILESIEPETDEVMEVHQTYLEGARLQMEGFNLVAQALKNQDRNLVDTANSKLNEGKSYIDQFQSDLKELADENGVTFK